jgi:N-methylhydantoinase B/oxoprolinase/acetone carboxylase alpha subunit
VVRTYEFLVPTEVTVLGERRRLPPPSLGGAPPGERGRETLVRATGERIALPAKVTFAAQPGDRLVVETPGGGHA